MPPTTLLFAHSSDELYGSDIVLLELVRRLDTRRFRPVVVTPTDLDYQGLLSQALRQAGVKHYALDMPVLRRRYFAPRRAFTFLRRLAFGPAHVRRLMAQEGVALVHSNTTAVWGGALAARPAHLPHLWHVHEIITQPVFIRKLIALMVARYSDHVVAISQAVANHLLADQPALASRLSVIYDAVDTERFHPGVDSRALRRAWGVDSGQVLAGVMGRISAWKGQELFLQALAQAAGQAPNLRGVIVGDVVPGEEWRRAELEQQAHALGIADRLIWAGYRSDTPQVIAALDLCVLPSLRPEPFGMVVLEAMAGGRPVIAAAHGGPLETVVEGETGCLAPPGDPSALAAALGRLAAQPGERARMGEQGRARAIAHFGFDAHVSAFQELYTNLLATPRSHVPTS